MYLNQRGVLNYHKDLKEAARQNRNNPTEAENKVWQEILRKEKSGYRFLRQKPIDNFILDFYCSELLLAIEIDGDVHCESEQKNYDTIRTDRLDDLGIKVLRYDNKEVINKIDSVYQDIMKQIKIRETELL